MFWCWYGFQMYEQVILRGVCVGCWLRDQYTSLRETRISIFRFFFFLFLNHRQFQNQKGGKINFCTLNFWYFPFCLSGLFDVHIEWWCRIVLVSKLFYNHHHMLKHRKLFKLHTCTASELKLSTMSHTFYFSS